MTKQSRRRSEHTTSTTTIKRGCAILAATLGAALLGAPTASAFVIGPGRDPGLAVDAAGTAFMAWNGPENPSTLRFCRLPRGATACDGGTTSSIAVPAETTGGGRPFVAVAGNRVSVVQYRYPLSGSSQNGTYLFTSPDRGANFGAGVRVGVVPFYEAIVGPDDTMSGLPHASSLRMAFQNVPLNGSPGPDGVHAQLSTTHPYYSAVGLIDAATPIAVYGDGSGNSQVRQYDGSGDLNDILNWTAPVDIGPLDTPKLAGGPKGLFLLTGDNHGNLLARKWNGSGFGAPAAVGPGRSASMHFFQDAGGRLHAVFQRDSANPLEIMHAVSDDGVTWRSGSLVKQDLSTDGGIESLRVATAADHIGVTVWHAGTGAGDVRVLAVGPDAPAAAVAPPPAAVTPPPPPAVTAKPVAKLKPSFTASASAKRIGRRVRIRITGELVPPAAVPDAKACTGKVIVTFRRAGKLVITRTLKIDKHCEFGFTAFVKKSKVKRSKKLAMRIQFLGNEALAVTAKVGSVKVTK